MKTKIVAKECRINLNKQSVVKKFFYFSLKSMFFRKLRSYLESIKIRQKKSPGNPGLS
jgi:hypothetical protein